MNDDGTPKRFFARTPGSGQPMRKGKVFMSVKAGGAKLKWKAGVPGAEEACADFMEWLQQVALDCKWGPAPLEAARELKCARATVDDLVRIGILERSVYEEQGHSVIMISLRSIERAKENKRVTGRWAGIPGAKYEYGK